MAASRQSDPSPSNPSGTVPASEASAIDVNRLPACADHDDQDAGGSAKGLSRRRLLKISGAVAAVAAAAGTGLDMAAAPTALAQNGTVPIPGGGTNPGAVSQRAQAAYNLRVRAAQMEMFMGQAVHPTNEDETLVPGFLGNYSKGLPHNNLGEVNPAAYNALLTAVNSGKPEDFEAIPMGGTVRLTNPQAGIAFALQGGDASAFFMPPAPGFRSAELASAMAENYWMALLRDVNFTDYPTNSLAQAAATSLSGFSDFKGPKAGGQVTTGTLFRGPTAGDLNGPYISQFMWLNTPFGAENIDRKMRTPVPNINFMTNYTEWLNIQRGIPPTQSLTFDPVRRYIRNGRDLAEWVHIDVLFQAYFNAMLILFNLGAPLDAGNPYIASTTQAGFGTLGAPYIASVLCAVAREALKAVWYQKWFVHRHLRPEVFAGRIHNHKTFQTFYNIHTDILNSSVLTEVFNRTGTYLLPMAFPEGSPTHPSYGAGHATVAGASVTVLKALFDESWVIPNPVVVSADGLSLEPYSGPALTVGGELNKLAANVAFGRNLAGVHWRHDGNESLKLGQDVAIRYLMEEHMAMNEKYAGLSLTRFDGTTITI